MKIKESIKVEVEKKEYPDMTLEDIKAMVKELNQKARESK